jgi:hypothetical protein
VGGSEAKKGPGPDFFSPRGAVKKKMTKATYMCRSAKKKVVTYFILFLFLFLFLFFIDFFGRFVTRGVQKDEKNFFFEKVHLGSSQKMRLFFLRFFFFSLGLFCSIFFYRVFGRLVTRGVQKRHKTNLRENLLSFQKKHPLTYVVFFFFFHGAPCPLHC